MKDRGAPAGEPERGVELVLARSTHSLLVPLGHRIAFRERDGRPGPCDPSRLRELAGRHPQHQGARDFRVQGRIVFEGIVEDLQRPHAANYAARSVE